MRLTRYILAGTLAFASIPAFAQQRDYKDTYTAEEGGKIIAPAAALDVMLTQLEVQVMRAAEAMPADKYTFAPSSATFVAGSPAAYNGVRTFAAELTHVAGANYFFYGKVSDAAVPIDLKALSAMTAKADVVTALQKSFAFAHAQIATISAKNAFLAIEGADGMHTRATLAAFGVAHGYDHYGQMVEYLRMNGILPAGSK